MSARADVLQRIRAANAAAGNPTPAPAPRAYVHTGTLAAGSAELMELLRDRLVDYKATVLDTTPDEVPAAIAGALEAAGVTGRVLVPSGLPEGWCPDGVPDEPGFTANDLDEFATMTPHAFSALDGPAEIVMTFDREGQRAHAHQ